MTQGYKVGAAVAGSVLIAALSFMVGHSAAGEASAVFQRLMWGLSVSSAVVAVALAIYGLAYLGTSKQRAAEQQRVDVGQKGHTPDRLDMRPVKPSKFWFNMALIFVGVLFISSAAGTGMSFSALLEMPARIWDFTTQMVGGVLQIPDEDRQSDWSNAFDAMLESVAIAWIGTLVGALFSLPCGILAARNMTPLAIYIPMRFILSVIRAVPELVFAVAIFIPLLGVGPAHMGGAMAGAFALGISSIGTLSKLISEAIEGVDDGPIEAARASGATHSQVIRWAVLPQALPEMIAIWLYRFEVNIRASAILGTLGAGGIGVLLNQVLRFQRDWERTGIAIAVIIIVTIAVDQISAFIRHRVIHGAKARKRSQKSSQKTVPREEKPKQQV